ncbi:MAG TPA: biopolymer transporter ExbD [Pirellulaceae bacterium]|nr:biopolymer transporter ExbD [Pirellulaceae bacterium]
MSASLNHGSNAEPDLVPMLDMVFQLITFFMLVINFKAAAMDLNLKLPVVGSAQPVDTNGQQDLLVLNINSTGELRVYGELKTDVNTYIAGEAQASLMVGQRENPELKFGDDLPSTVVIRADKRTPFSLLNKVVKACQDNGYRKFALKAMSKEAGK